MNDVDKALRDLQRQGYTVSMTKKNHRQVRDPSGRIVASTGHYGGGLRQVRHLRNNIRRAERNSSSN
jgi:hypothetical protein